MPRRRASNLIVYTSDTCPACDDVKPILSDLSKKTGVRLKYQEIEKCKPDDKFCQDLQWVPTVAQCDVGGSCKEIPLEQVPDKMKSLSRKK